MYFCKKKGKCRFFKSELIAIGTATNDDHEYPGVSDNKLVGPISTHRVIGEPGHDLSTLHRMEREN